MVMYNSDRKENRKGKRRLFEEIAPPFLSNYCERGIHKWARLGEELHGVGGLRQWR